MDRHSKRERALLYSSLTSTSLAQRKKINGNPNQHGGSGQVQGQDHSPVNRGCERVRTPGGGGGGGGSGGVDVKIEKEEAAAAAAEKDYERGCCRCVCWCASREFIRVFPRLITTSGEWLRSVPMYRVKSAVQDSKGIESSRQTTNGGWKASKEVSTGPAGDLTEQERRRMQIAGSRSLMLDDAGEATR